MSHTERCSAEAGELCGQGWWTGRSWQTVLSDERGPGRPMGSHPGLAEMKEEEGKGGVET